MWLYLHFIFSISWQTCSSQGKTHSWPGCRCNMRWRGQEGWRAGAVRTAGGTLSSQYGVLTNSWWWSCFHKGHMGGLNGYGGTSLVRQTLKTRNISYIVLCNSRCILHYTKMWIKPYSYSLCPCISFYSLFFPILAPSVLSCWQGLHCYTAGLSTGG